METYSAWVWGGLASLVCLGLGALIQAWWMRKLARERRRIPKRWPLSPRTLANSEERRVWRWLIRAFFDHHVMIKIPVTRFTLPRTREHGLHWYELLSGVYCTFTICRADGHVVGCVDVPGRFGLARKNQVLKQTLLSQCGIAYCVVQSESLPSLTEIRTEFLGDMASMTHDRERDEAALKAARNSLRAALDRQRHTRSSDFSALSTSPDLAGDSAHSELSGPWQANSFLTPLDSRKIGL